MDGLETSQGFFNILDEPKSYNLDELFDFEFVSHLEFGCFGSTWLR